MKNHIYTIFSSLLILMAFSASADERRAESAYKLLELESESSLRSACKGQVNASALSKEYFRLEEKWGELFKKYSNDENARLIEALESAALVTLVFGLTLPTQVFEHPNVHPEVQCSLNMRALAKALGDKKAKAETVRSVADAWLGCRSAISFKGNVSAYIKSEAGFASVWAKCMQRFASPDGGDLD